MTTNGVTCSVEFVEQDTTQGSRYNVKWDIQKGVGFDYFSLQEEYGDPF